ncbi:hypothetical protein [Iningainema tapete]|uniref:Uncharacterized protein n=1 Tax=Iningainema tapete BLCC-T55 TaxID=2748662 RepID=A0A8J6XMA0_9CYAN|nr:hypothetical protein [Iningainema tapete]MBD2777518.1 hypothetical protein [Iningainema tapete BLCC-T55]
MQNNINHSFPKGRTAFLVIHGIGEQNPFETMDYFARNLTKYFENQNLDLKLEHLIAKRRLSTGSIWTESFVRLNSNDENSLIDIHEYYWAYQTENQISVPEILRWAEQTLDGTIKFYNRTENKPLLAELLKTKKGKSFFVFRLRWVTILLRLFNLIYPVLRLLLWVVLSLASPFLRGSFLQPTWQLSKKLVTPLLVDYIGDIAIYTTTDVKSPRQKIRELILAESSTLLKAILRDQQANYDQVILVGHSLGSCITYDTLNHLCIEASLRGDKGKNLHLDKITGLVTFGSPLDKIAFFFREVAQQGQYIRQRILEHLNSFRVKPVANESSFFTTHPVNCHLDQVKWVNYYHLQDPISGHLDYYENLENVRLEFPATWGEQGHLGYWTDPNFYEEIAKRFLHTVKQNGEIEKSASARN